MTVNIEKLTTAKTIAQLEQAGLTVDQIVGACKTTFVQRAKQLEVGKENRQLLAALKANPTALAQLKAKK